MAITKEERILLKNLANGMYDGVVGRDLITTGGSTIWKEINNGIPIMFKQGPDRKFFDGKENIRCEGVLHTLQQWITDEQKVEFLRKFGFLMKDAAVKTYSAKYKPTM